MQQAGKIAQRGTLRLGLFGKLLLVLLPCLLTATAAGTWWLIEIEDSTQRDRFATRIGNISARVASGIERYRWNNNGIDDWDHPLPQALLSTLLGDQAVRCVELFVGATSSPVLIAPRGIGCTGIAPDSSIALPVGTESQDWLIVHYDQDEIRHSHLSRQFYALGFLIGGFLVTILSCWIAFRYVVGIPLRNLLHAIETRKQRGQSELIANVPRDELGTVIDAYNEMQQHIDDESAGVGNALQRLDHIYNTTPALLCSIRLDGTISRVSDHWLSIMGLERNQVLGRSLNQFASPVSRMYVCPEVLASLAREGEARDVPIELITSQGEELHFLLSAQRDETRDGEPLALCVMTDISLLKDAEQRLQKLALSDTLTELPNRRGLIEHLDHVIAREHVTENHSIMAVLFVDLDGFKWINDTYGHEAGDMLLVETAKRLQHCVRVNDMIARLGGDEFALVCHRLESPDIAERIAERVIEMVGHPFQLGEVQGHVGASIGIAYLSEKVAHSDEILRLADLAMYAAKKAGKGCFRTYCDDLSQKAAATSAIQKSIRDGLRHGWFSLAYQPIVRLDDGQPIGAEALLRLHCPDHGAIQPDIFIPVAEETGLIRDLGNWVVDESTRQLKALARQEQTNELYVSINLSTKQLTYEFSSRLRKFFLEHPELKRRLVIEVNELALMSRDDSALAQLVATREAGALIAIDDFGTGYSSLSQIQKLPIDILKIDRTLVSGLIHRDMEETRHQMATIRATVSLAEELGIAVIAEGVEHEQTIDILRDAGIGIGQGYHFSAPLDDVQFRHFLGQASEPAVAMPPALDQVAE